MEFNVEYDKHLSVNNRDQLSRINYPKKSNNRERFPLRRCQTDLNIAY